MIDKVRGRTEKARGEHLKSTPLPTRDRLVEQDYLFRIIARLMV